MNKGKETASRRRTIAVSVPLTASVKEKSQSNGGIASFFFGQKTKTNTSTATATLLSNKSNEALSKSGSDSAKSGKLSRPSSLNLFRANSNTSVNSIASKNSVSSMGSFSNSIKGSNSTKAGAHDSPSLIPRTMSSNDELEKAEHMAIQVSMKLNLWEADVRPKSVTKKTKRSLNRDNSTGSNVSNISNISNNSNISILSNGSNDSRPTSVRSHGSLSPKNIPSPFNAAAAAAASRERFFGTPSPTPSMLAAEADAAVNSSAEHAHDLHAASHELLLSSGENSPQLTARTESNSSADNTIAGAIVGDFAVPVPVTVQVPAPVKPSLKKSMEPLPNKREGLQRARNSWVATVTEGIRPKMVKFTSSTKSMGELLLRETSKEGKENLIVSAFMQVRANSNKTADAEPQPEVEEVAAVNVSSAPEDIHIVGATIVEETDEDEAAVSVTVTAEMPVPVSQSPLPEEPSDLPHEPSATPSVAEVEVEQMARSEALAVEAPPAEPVQQVEEEQRRVSPLALEVEPEPVYETAKLAAAAPASPVPAPSPANPAKVVLRHTTPNTTSNAGNSEGGGLERHGSGMLVMPALSPVPLTHKIVTPVRVEFVEVKLKHTDSALSLAVGSPNSIVNNGEGASTGESLMEEAVDGEAEQVRTVSMYDVASDVFLRFRI